MYSDLHMTHTKETIFFLSTNIHAKNTLIIYYYFPFVFIAITYSTHYVRKMCIKSFTDVKKNSSEYIYILEIEYFQSIKNSVT